MQQHAETMAGARKALPAPLPSSRILVVDDEADACEAIRLVLESEGYDVAPETSAHAAIERVEHERFDLVVTDVSMAEMNGLDLCRRLAELAPRLPVILLTGRGTMNTVIAALRIGARDFLTKPIDADALLGAARRALEVPVPRPLESAASEQRAERGAGSVVASPTSLLGESAAMRQVAATVASISQSVASVLIQGDTGTGKELVALAIHAGSRYGQGPFVALNCAAMPAELLESELFGHARGAFTGANTAKQGLLVQAHGGTLLLDEIAELPLVMQPKLLRALQERVVRPLGATTEVPFECRLIAATNRDLEIEVAEQRFRKDLYYRIDVLRVAVPALRDRGKDVLLLAGHFLARFAHGAQPAKLSDAAAERLLAYPWPGNVRELENCIEHAVTFCRSSEIGIDDLPERLRFLDTREEMPPTTPPHGGPEHGVDSAVPNVVPLSELERYHVLRAVKLLGGNKTLAASLLGIDRRTLYRRLREYGYLSADERWSAE